MKTVEMKEENMPLWCRLIEFPWLLSDLIFPFMMEYLVSLNQRKDANDELELLTSLVDLVPDLGNDTEYPS